MLAPLLLTSVRIELTETMLPRNVSPAAMDPATMGVANDVPDQMPSVPSHQKLLIPVDGAQESAALFQLLKEAL